MPCSFSSAVSCFCLPSRIIRCCAGQFLGSAKSLLCPLQVLVAAFAVSGYSSTFFRAGSKPFNPLLGETYECIREDKGYCFFSEQVRPFGPWVFFLQVWWCLRSRDLLTRGRAARSSIKTHLLLFLQFFPMAKMSLSAVCFFPLPEATGDTHTDNTQHTHTVNLSLKMSNVPLKC